jgi:hypothetical protein
MPDQDLLSTYLQDHFAGATGGLELAKRIARQLPEPAVDGIAAEIESDRDMLREVMSALGVSPSTLKVGMGWLGERVGRLKLNQRVFGRSPLSDVLELEGLIVGVSGKLQLWRALALIAPTEARLQRFDFERLARRAEDQRHRLEDMHARAVRRGLDEGGGSA